MTGKPYGKCLSSSHHMARRALTLGLLHLYRGGDPVGLSPNIRIYRYKPKQFFDAHCRLNWLKHDSCFLSLLPQ